MSSSSLTVMPRLEGYLKKYKTRPKLLSSHYNKRWFSVEAISGTENKSFQLRYYNDQPATKLDKPSATVNIISIQSIAEIQSTPLSASLKLTDPFVFVIETLERNFVLKANSQMEMSSWIQGLRAYVEYEKSILKQFNPVQQAQITKTPAIPNTTSNSFSTRPHSPTNNPADHILSTHNSNSTGTTPPKQAALLAHNSSNNGPIPTANNFFATNNINNNKSNIPAQNKSTSAGAMVTNAPAPVFAAARINDSAVQSPIKANSGTSPATNKAPTLVNSAPSQRFSTPINVSNAKPKQEPRSGSNAAAVNLEDSEEFSLGDSNDNLGQSGSLELNLDSEEEPSKFQHQLIPNNSKPQQGASKPRRAQEFTETASNHTNEIIDLQEDWSVNHFIKIYLPRSGLAALSCAVELTFTDSL
jgi:hypothetical protein